jgi:hypothetical protein
MLGTWGRRRLGRLPFHIWEALCLLRGHDTVADLLLLQTLRSRLAIPERQMKRGGRLPTPVSDPVRSFCLGFRRVGLFVRSL